MDERAPNQFPVTELADNRLELPGGGVLPLCLNQDWAADLSGVRGALVMLHGRLRDAPTYMRTALAAVGTRPGWLVAVPQFLAAIDLPAHGLPADTLHWELTGWMGGDAAEGRWRRHPSPPSTRCWTASRRNAHDWNGWCWRGIPAAARWRNAMRCWARNGQACAT
jgi:hypothetical protein